MEIILATKEHVNEIFEIEKQSFSTPYTLKMIEDMLNDDKYLYLLAKSDEICGFVGVNIILDEADITNVAVLQKYQGQKIGEKLMQAIILELRKRAVIKLHLEVRESNQKAINLYEKLGFKPIYIRKNYYKNPTEHAKIYTLEV